MRIIFNALFFLIFSSVGFSQSQDYMVITVGERDSSLTSNIDQLVEGSDLFFVFVCDDDIYWDCRMRVLDSLIKNERYDIKYQAVKLRRSNSGRKHQIIFGERAEPNTFFVYSKHKSVAITMDQMFVPLKKYNNWYAIDLGICETDECLKFRKNVVGRVDLLKKRYKEIFHAIEDNDILSACLTRMDSLESKLASLELKMARRPEMLVGINYGKSCPLDRYPLIGDYLSGNVNVDIFYKPEFGFEITSLRLSARERLKFYFSGGISRSRSDISFVCDSLLFRIQDSSLESNLTRYRMKSIKENYYFKTLNIPLSIGGYTSIGSSAYFMLGVGLKFSKSYSGGFSNYTYLENNFVSDINSDLTLDNLPSLDLVSYSSNNPTYTFKQASWYSLFANAQFLWVKQKYFFAISINYDRNASFTGEKRITSTSIRESEVLYSTDFESRIKHNVAAQIKFGLNINK